MIINIEYNFKEEHVNLATVNLLYESMYAIIVCFILKLQLLFDVPKIKIFVFTFQGASFVRLLITANFYNMSQQ